MLQSLRYGDCNLGMILATEGDSEVGFFVEEDLEQTDTIKIETRFFPLCLDF